jgi:drug/metabolite transporter (DMT)-like permease
MSRTIANLLLLLAAVCWGSGNVAQQTVLEHIGPLTATGLKSFIAAAVILPYCLRTSGERRKMDATGHLLALLTVLSFAAATALMQIAYGLTSVTNAGFLVNTATVLTPIFAWLFLRQRPANIIWLAASATFVGAMLMGGGHMGALSAGDLLSLGAAACFAVWMVALGEFVTLYDRAGVITIAQFGVTAAIFIPCGIILETATLPDLFAATPDLLYISVVSTAGGYLLQAIAQRHTSSCEAAVIVSAEAVFGAIAAMLILGEQLSFERAIGAGLIIASIILVQMPHKRARSQKTSQNNSSVLMPGE